MVEKRGVLFADATVHAVPAALPASSMAKTATMAKMASATHVVLMATSVVADILMLYDGDGVDVMSHVMRVVHDAAGTCMRLADLQMLDRRTHHHPVSAPVNNLKVCSAQAGPSSIVLSCVAAAEQDSASDG